MCRHQLCLVMSAEPESYDYDPAKGIKFVMWEQSGAQHVWVWFTKDSVWWSVDRDSLEDPELVKIAGAVFSNE